MAPAVFKTVVPSKGGRWVRLLCTSAIKEKVFLRVCMGAWAAKMMRRRNLYTLYTQSHSLTATLARIPLVAFTCNGLGAPIKVDRVRISG